MYVDTARSSYALRRASGTTNHPTRSPGATVFENDDVKVTRSPPSSAWSAGGAVPSYRTRPYGSSSSTSRSCARQSSAIRRRRSSLRVRPLGFWNVGIV